MIHAHHLNPLGLKWSQFVLAETAANHLIGCGQVKQHRSGPRELASIAIIPAHRRQGIAAAIITHLQTIHPPPLWLTCESRLIPFYQKFGFSDVQEIALMPPYFRLIYRLSRWVMRLAKTDKYIAVMLWEG